MPQPGRHRLELRCPTGNPSEATIHLDGEQLPWVSRIELVLDSNTREATARLTIPAAILDLDVDTAAFITEHTDHEKLLSGETTINDHRRSLGMPHAAPDVGAAVHYLWAGNHHCIPASVGGIQTDGTRLNLDIQPGTPGPSFADGIEEDPTARTASTWHWPCDNPRTGRSSTSGHEEGGLPGTS